MNTSRAWTAWNWRKLLLVAAFALLPACLGLRSSASSAAPEEQAAAGASRDLHVAQNHPAASDENDGSADKPWKTINRALPELRAGDTLHVHKGVYREQVVLRKDKWAFIKWTYQPTASGESATRPIRLVAESNDVFIKGSDVVTGWAKHKDNIYVRDWDLNSQQVFSDSEILQQIAGKMAGFLNDVWAGPKGKGLADMEAGSFYYGIENKKMYVWLKDGGDPNKHEIEISVRPFIFSADVDHLYISGFQMMHSTTTTWVNWGAVGISGSHNVMENCRIQWTDFGAGLGGNCNTIRNCDLSHHGAWGLAGGGWGNMVLDSRLAYNNYRHFKSGWGAGGMKIIPCAHNWIVSGCTVEHNIKSDGIWFDAANANVLIQNNICRYNDGSGIHYEISERGIIRNNLCYENKGRGIYLSNSADTIVLHNICFGNGMSGICAHGVERRGDATADSETGYMPARNVVVMGNILVDNCNPKLCPKDKDHTSNTWERRPELIMPDPRIASNTGGRSDYNIFFRTDGRNIPFWENFGGGVYGDLKQWQDKTGNDRNSIIAMPKFMDLEKRDFRPAKGSVAIQFVRPQMSIALDFDGTQRPRWAKTLYTAGAFEAPKEFLTLPEKKEFASQLKALDLAKHLAELTTPELKEFAKILEAVPVEGGLAKLANAPYALAKPAKAVILDAKNPEAVLEINRSVKDLRLLVAVLNPGKGVQFRAVIARGDGHAIPLRWETGKNIAPSVGAWQGELASDTSVAWEPADKSARLFASIWKNENEWLPVQRIKLTLDDKSATVLILGLSADSID